MEWGEELNLGHAKCEVALGYPSGDIRGSCPYKSEVQGFSHRVGIYHNEGDSKNHKSGWESPKETTEKEKRGGEWWRGEQRRGGERRMRTGNTKVLRVTKRKGNHMKKYSER